MENIRKIIAGLNWSYLAELALAVIPALICITVHEMAHGLAAYMLGDQTAKRQKRISLNPLRHIDPIGLLMLVVFKFGWARPVSVDMRNFKNPKRDMALTALAGPVTNILLACFLLFVRGFLYVPLIKHKMILNFFETTAILSIYLGIFNLIPIPPLDGSKVLFSFLPERTYGRLMHYERYGMILLLLLLLSGTIQQPLNNALIFVLKKIDFLTISGFKLYSMIF
jgi:Zn-dependent protease